MQRQDLNLFSEVLRELYAHTQADTLPHCVVRLLHRMIPADSAVYNSFDFRTGDLQVVHDLGSEGDRYLPVLNEHIQQHPLMLHVRKHWRDGAASLADVISRRQLRDTAVYREFLHPLGIEQQLGLLVEDLEYGVPAVSLQRAGGLFSARDEELLTLLQPHLIQAFRNAADLTALRSETEGLKQAVDASSLGVMRMRLNGKIEWISSRAQALLAEYFRAEAAETNQDRAPKELLDWILCPPARLRGRKEASFVGPRGELGVRWSSEGEERICVILTNRLRTTTAADLASLGLTVRETEVLHWIAEGKSNEDAGRILRISKRTVEKHLEKIFAKLGVENRTAAVLRAAECRLHPD